MRSFATIILAAWLLAPLMALAQQSGRETAVDVYPSERAAAQAMADQFARTLKDLPAIDAPRTRILITADTPAAESFSMHASVGAVSSSVTASATVAHPQDLADRIVTIVADRTRWHFPAVRVFSTPASGDSPSAVVHISLSDVAHVQNSADSGFEGRLHGTLEVSEITRAFDAGFSAKPWVDDWGAFVNSQPTATWLAGRSNRIAISAAEAENAALDDAARQVIPMMEYGWGGSLDYASRLRIISGQLRSHATDRFIQRTDHPYGSTWTAAVLVSGDPNTLRQIAPAVARVNNERVAWARSGFVSIFVLTIAIIALYLVLNAITRGYFTWRLRLGALGLLLVIGVLLLVTLFFARVSMSPVAVPVRGTVTFDGRTH